MTTNLTPSRKSGISKHGSNPFIGTTIANTRAGSKRIYDTTGHKMMVVSGDTGEIIAPAGFWQYQEVDKTQFVKLFVNGVKALKELTSAGTTVFEILYLRVQDNVGKDMVYMAFQALDQTITSISQSTYHRGLKELLVKDFIAESNMPGWYYINPDYMWNGDRLAFVKEYRKATTKTVTRQIDPRQTDLVEYIEAATQPTPEQE